MKMFLALAIAAATSITSFQAHGAEEDVGVKIKRCGLMGRLGGYAHVSRKMSSTSVDQYMGSYANHYKTRLDEGKITVAEANAGLTMHEDIALIVFSLPVRLTPEFVQQRVQQECLEGNTR